MAVIAWRVYDATKASNQTSPQPQTSGNYAKDAAQPLEAALIQAGATKICEIGDPGQGSDNRSPGYEARFELNKPKEDAVSTVTKIAKDNGYNLTHQQSPYDYVSWYSDDVGKKSTYPGFTDGSVRVGFNLYNGGDKLTCEGTPLRADTNNTAVTLSTSLPSSD